MLPKIHKFTVISSVNFHSTKILEFVDYHLQEPVAKLPSYIYIKDTTNFINKIKDVIVDDKTTLVTMDVSSLYTNIPNDKGSNAVKQTQDTTTIHQNNIGISTSNPYTKQFYFLTASATYWRLRNKNEMRIQLRKHIHEGFEDKHIYQALSYEACNRTRAPQHVPKLLKTCSKSTPR